VPDAVLPFKNTQDDAVARIRAFADGRKFFANARFKAEFAPENVMGVYMPYMVVGAKAAAAMAGQGEILLRRYTRGSGKDERTYYDADVYQIDRQIRFTAEDMAIESSAERANMNTRVNTNNVINAILPFDTKQAVVWNADYLVGFTSEKRDQNVEALMPRVETHLLSIARAHVEPSVKRYDRGVRWEREQLDVAGTRWVAMYLPIWLYSYFQANANGGKGLLHYIAVNARTGKTMGSIPIAKAKLAAVALAIGAIVEILGIRLFDMSDSSNFIVYASGPAAAAAYYWMMYRRYRNTDKTEQYERETVVQAQPVEGADTKVNTIKGTQADEINGRNESNYRQRVTRVR
ncbi:MAG: hypothetical protein LBQ32_13385, partial [Burkholderiaceae bacterium]|jgi:hypothetical protein|nr:hypothetical protein [Burkholderiaceae bacterium]